MSEIKILINTMEVFMSDVSNNEQPLKKKFVSLDPMASPGIFGAFGGLFIIQGIISLVWGITERSWRFNAQVAEVLTALSLRILLTWQFAFMG
jgi:hypothetical protein